MTGRKIRIISLEYLRILSMLMIIVLHVQGKTGWINAFNTGKGDWLLRWSVQALVIPAVNCYVLISGFFLIDSKVSLSKILKLWLRVVFWSIICTFICSIISPESVSLIDYYRAIIPFSSCEYWFVTVYIGMYSFSPFIAKTLRHVSKREHFTLMCIMLLFCTILPSVFPVASPDGRGLNGINGTNLLWFITLFVVAAYIKLYCFPSRKNVRSIGALLYFLMACINVIGKFVFSYCGEHFGVLGSFASYYFNYASLICFLSSMGLFLAFLPQGEQSQTQGTVDKFIIDISACTFGVYLIHECPAVRNVLWNKVISIYDGFVPSLTYPLVVLVIALSIFMICALLEKIRIILLSNLENRLAEKMSNRIMSLYQGVIDRCIGKGE